MNTDPTAHELTTAEPVHWHTLEGPAALQQLASDRQTGLTAAQVRDRQQQYGLNEIEATSGRSRWQILVDQFTNIMLLMLAAVAVVSAVLDIRGQTLPKDAIAIFLIVILNGVLGYIQESRAEQALAALKQMSSPLVRAIREERLIEIPAKELVPGDVILLEAGVQIPADGLLLEEANLQVRESALTGEAHAVSKDALTPLPADTALGDRANLVFQGTEVLQGRGVVLVTNTGMTTELGKIASMLQSVESEPTPLQERMTQLGNTLVTGSLVLVAIVVAVGVFSAGWGAFEDLLEVSLSMAVAVVPEGLPAVITVTLALGTQRMVKRQALIRKLPAVETLGSVTTICSDKTGTLTQNKMVVQEVGLVDETFQVTGMGYEPSGEFWQQATAIAPADYAGLRLTLLCCLLCNDATLQKENGEWVILGDPTEGALITLAGKAGLNQQQWLYALARVREFPFTSERKRMSVVVTAAAATAGSPSDREATLAWLTACTPSAASPYLLCAKGSPELVLQRCSQVQRGNTVQPLTDQDRAYILGQNEQMAGRGLRVLGFAYRPLSEVPDDEAGDTAERDLIWLGLTGMLDAPRPEVRQAVAKSRQAGIRPIMITGDHQLTAKALALDLGIINAGDRVLNGQELEKMSQAELDQAVSQVGVYARVSPAHKLRIVQSLQKQHQIVAMTGDGVNDAPALKQADIGIAMGITGTDVSKEASDMVLLDDNFATIVAATEEGRVVYTNIRRFVKYILGSNIGEVLTIAVSPILIPLGVGGVPLTPLQILWMNLVTDGLPALALAVEPPEPNVMNRPPHSPRESIFARGLGAYMIRVGLIFAVISIGLMQWSYLYAQQGGDPERWKTMVFTTLCIAQMGHAIAVRSNTQLTIEMNLFSNPYVLGAVVLTTLLQLMLIYIEPLRTFFGTQVLSPTELLICFGFSSLMFVWVEVEKLAIRLWSKYKGIPIQD